MDKFEHFRSAIDALPPHLKETCDHVWALKTKYPHTEDFWNALYSIDMTRNRRENRLTTIQIMHQILPMSNLVSSHVAAIMTNAQRLVPNLKLLTVLKEGRSRKRAMSLVLIRRDLMLR